MNKKVKVIIGSVLLFVIILVLIISITLVKNKKNDIEKDNIVQFKDKSIENNKIKLENFTLTYLDDNKQYLLKFILNNTSRDDINLIEYNINLKDKNKNIVRTYKGDTFGIINANSKIIKEYYIDEECSNVVDIEIVKVGK